MSTRDSNLLPQQVSRQTPTDQSPHTYRSVATYLQASRQIPTDRSPHTYRPVATYLQASRHIPTDQLPNTYRPTPHTARPQGPFLLHLTTENVLNLSAQCVNI